MRSILQVELVATIAYRHRLAVLQIEDGNGVVRCESLTDLHIRGHGMVRILLIERLLTIEA